MSDFDRHVRFYDLEHDDYQDDLVMYAGFAAAVARPVKGARSAARVLELACGTGRCLLPLASAGHHVTGLDVSEAMLDVARQKVEAAGLQDRVRLFCGDMRAFELEQRFDLAIIALNSLMHLETREEQRQALACAAAHLAPGGRLVVDLFNPDTALPEPGQEGQLFLHCLKVLPGGVHLLHFQSPAVDRGAQLVRMANFYDEIQPDGALRRHVSPFTLRYLTRGELELLLPQAGLNLEALYGGYDLEPSDGHSTKLIVVASAGGRG